MCKWMPLSAIARSFVSRLIVGQQEEDTPSDITLVDDNMIRRVYAIDDQNKICKLMRYWAIARRYAEGSAEINTKKIFEKMRRLAIQKSYAIAYASGGNKPSFGERIRRLAKARLRGRR